MTTQDRRQYVLGKCDGRMFSSEVVRELCHDLEALETEHLVLKNRLAIAEAALAQALRPAPPAPAEETA